MSRPSRELRHNASTLNGLKFTQTQEGPLKNCRRGPCSAVTEPALLPAPSSRPQRPAFPHARFVRFQHPGCFCGMSAGRGVDQIVTQLGHGGIEVGYVSVNTRLHHCTFHNNQHEPGKSGVVKFASSSFCRIIEAFANHLRPLSKIGLDQSEYFSIAGVDFQRKSTYRTPVCAIGSFEPSAIPIEDAKDPLKRVARCLEYRRYYFFLEPLQVQLENSHKDCLFALEKVIETPALSA
jgi:hypothetical protein